MWPSSRPSWRPSGRPASADPPLCRTGSARSGMRGRGAPDGACCCGTPWVRKPGQTRAGSEGAVVRMPSLGPRVQWPVVFVGENPLSMLEHPGGDSSSPWRVYGVLPLLSRATGTRKPPFWTCAWTITGRLADLERGWCVRCLGGSYLRYPCDDYFAHPPLYSERICEVAGQAAASTTARTITNLAGS